MNEALVAAHALRTGCGQQQVMHAVNAWREKKGKGTVSVSAMRSSICKPATVTKHWRKGRRNLRCWIPFSVWG